MFIRIFLHILFRLGKPAVAVLLVYRRLRYGYSFRRIRMSGPKYAIVDPTDYERLKGYEWFVRPSTNSYYAFRHVPYNGRSKGKSIYMHKDVIHVPEGMVADHINHNGMDNRQANLRAATKAQNTCNRTKNIKPTSSKYKGVCWHKRNRKWIARIGFNKKKKFLGHFDKEADAARAYDKAAKKYHGEFACLNFPEPSK